MMIERRRQSVFERDTGRTTVNRRRINDEAVPEVSSSSSLALGTGVGCGCSFFVRVLTYCPPCPASPQGNRKNNRRQASA